jgi:hypothetical protein
LFLQYSIHLMSITSLPFLFSMLNLCFT